MYIPIRVDVWVGAHCACIISIRKKKKKGLGFTEITIGEKKKSLDNYSITDTDGSVYILVYYN